MFERIVTRKNGRRYRYLQWSKRIPGRRTPKTYSVYLGPADSFEERQDRALLVAERAAERCDAWQREHLGETAAERDARERSAREFNAERFLDETSEPAQAAEQSPDDAPSTDGEPE